MALTVDTIESVLKVRTADYIRDMKAATDVYNKWRNAQSGEAQVTAEVERASTRRASAKRKDVETEVQAQARISAAVDRGIAKREQEATAAERAADRIARAGSRRIAAEQTRLMSGTVLSAAPGQGPTSAINYALRDQIDLRNKLANATTVGDQKAVDGIQDQLRYLSLLRQYKQAGLDDTKAAARAEQGVTDAVQARVAAESRLASAGIAGAGRAANATRNLGRQFQDIGVGLVGGQGVFLVLAQQIPQVADALTDMTPKAGLAGAAIKALRFFATPVGAILLAAASAAVIFGSRLFETTKTVNESVEALKKEAAEAEINRRAKEVFAKTTQGLTEALREQEKAIKSLENAEKSAAQTANENANARLKETIATRDATKLALEDEKRLLQAQIESSKRVSDPDQVLSQTIISQEARVRAIDAELATNNAQIAKAQEHLNQTRLALGKEQARTAAERSVRLQSPAGRAEITAEDQIKQLNKDADAAALSASGNLKKQQEIYAKLAIDIRNVTIARDAELKKIQEANREANKAPQNRLILQSPVSGGTVTSGIGARTRPTAGASTNHNGIDIGGLPIGTPVRAGANGVVITSGKLRGFGNAVVVDYGGGTIATYGHLSSLAVERGQRVTAGEQLGGLGNTGVSTGPHLHYEVRTNGRVVDPRRPVRVGDQAKAEARDAAQEQRDAEREREEAKRNLDKYNDQLANLDEQILGLREKEVLSLEEQDTYAQASIERAQIERDAGYERQLRDREIDATQRDELVARSATVASLQKIAVQADTAAKRREEADAKAGALLDANEAELRYQQESTNSIARKNQIEAQIIELRYDALLAAQQQIIEDDKATEAAKELARIRVTQIEAERGSARAGAQREAQSPLERYRSSIAQVGNNINDSLEQIEVRGLESLNDKLTDTISNVFKLGGAFGEIANQIISDLIRIAVQQAIIKPLAGGGDGGGILGFLGGIIGGGGNPVGAAASTFSSIFKGVSGRAVGGPVNAGTFYKTSEYGTEGYASFSQPGRVIPLGEMRTKNSNGPTVVNQTVQVDARNSVNPEGFARQILTISAQQAQQAASIGSRAAIKAAPGAVASNRRFSG